MSTTPSKSTSDHLMPEDVEAALQSQGSAPGGIVMDIVLTPARKEGPGPVLGLQSSTSSAPPLEDRLSAAESRRAAIDTAKVANLSERLAKVEIVKMKKEELVAEKAMKVKEEMEAKLEKTEENRVAQLVETKERLGEHLARVEKAQKNLEIQTEAARVAAEIAIKEKMTKAEENKDEQMEIMLKKIKEHEEYVRKVKESQETRLKPYLAELEVNIQEKQTIAEKRREEVLGKVIETASEASRRAETVRKNKAKLQESEDGPTSPGTVPESA